MIKSILIANRSEIAFRIIQACREMDIKVGIVYCKEDAESLAVKQADEAFFIDSSKNKIPYLDMDKIIEVCMDRGYEAIHPGYGFLSENADFAQKCKDSNIKFIGPNPDILKIAGDKYEAKRIAENIQIPVIEEFQISEITKKDFPILLKSSCGGGGKGIRIINDLSEFDSAYNAVKRESEKSFGRGKVLIEKYISKARHIEVQIVADEYGNIVHLYERECSIQRKMQKIIEEAPSYNLLYRIRQSLYKYAVKLAKRINYTNVGTFEFLIDKDFNPYFLEVNPRIQVEHGVTEEVTGIDIVKEQIRIASGKKLSFSQEDIKKNGHSLEYRINAENIEDNFKPSVGKITELILPTGKDIRLSCDLYTGKNVYTNFDPLILKVIIKSHNRDLSIKRAIQSLKELKIKGINTNVSLIKAILRNKNFSSGNISTEFISINNSLKAAKRIIYEENLNNSLNLHELEFEKNARLVALVFDKLSNEGNFNNNVNNWVLKNRLN